MGVFSFKAYKQAGLTNSESPDIGDLCASRLFYKYYCTSKTCCRYEVSQKNIYNKKNNINEKLTKYKYKEKVLKFRSQEHHTDCPSCGQPLVSKKEIGI